MSLSRSGKMIQLLNIAFHRNQESLTFETVNIKNGLTE